MADLSKQTQDFKDSIYTLLSGIQPVDGGGNISVERFNLIGQVKIKIDELLPEGEGVQFEVQDLVNTTDTVDVQINSLLDPCAYQLHQLAPIGFISGKLSTANPVINTDLSGYVEVPDDYIRLISFKMTAWKREVTGDKLITPSHPKYKLQHNIYSRGGKDKPVCVITQKNIAGTLKRVIQFFSLSTGDAQTIEQFIYVPEVVAESIQSNLIDSLTWLVAAKVLEIQGRSVASKNALEFFSSSFQNLM